MAQVNRGGAASPRTALDFQAIRTDLVLSWGHLPDCGEGGEFPWDCTCGYQGRIERMESVIARAEAAQEAPDPEGLRAMAALLAWRDFRFEGLTPDELRTAIATADYYKPDWRTAAPARPEEAS